MTAQFIPSVSFDSSTLPPEQQFAAQQGFMNSFKVSTPNPEKGFFARSRAWIVDGMLVNLSNLGPIDIERSTAMIRSDNVNHYIAAVILEGSIWEADFDGVEARVETGETCMIDMTRPFHGHPGPGLSITVLIPRQMLDEVLPPRDIHGVVLDAPAGRLLTDYLAALVRRLPALPASDAPAIARSTRDILAATLTTAPGRPADPKSTRILLHAKRHIAQHLADDLSADVLAGVLGVSRATLFRAFEHMGGLEGFVRARRLARAHEMLTRADGPRAISQIAYAVGFKSGAHFSRAFRTAYGCTASELQAGKPGEALASPLDMDIHRVYAQWSEALR